MVKIDVRIRSFRILGFSDGFAVCTKAQPLVEVLTQLRKGPNNPYHTSQGRIELLVYGTICPVICSLNDAQRRRIRTAAAGLGFTQLFTKL